MPNGGSDCCGSCWFNRSNGGKRGSAYHNRNIPSYCEIRQLDIPNPFWTYCANHPYRRIDRDPIPIGPVYVHGAADDAREFWQPSPDTEEIRLHLLDLIRSPEKHKDGYPFYSPAPHMTAIEQLMDFGDRRVVEALEDLAKRDEVKEVRPDILELIETLREKLSP